MGICSTREVINVCFKIPTQQWSDKEEEIREGGRGSRVKTTLSYRKRPPREFENVVLRGRPFNSSEGGAG